jgi:serine/threonine protein kinase
VQSTIRTPAVTLSNAEAPSVDWAPSDTASRSFGHPSADTDQGFDQGGPDIPAPYPRGWALAPGYRVLNHVSRGKAHDVYEVFSDERLCSCIAKIIRPDRREGPRLDRLRNEGRILQRLAHPHLVRCWDVLDEPQLTVIIETIPGTTLKEAVEERRHRYAAYDVAHLGRHLCSALHYLHHEGVLHLDIRPGNIMAEAGIVKLIDLSLASTPGSAHRGRGTRYYMAPEQALGDSLSSATDVWGIGATMYEAATGHPPFAPVDEVEQAYYDDDHGYLQLRRPAPSVGFWGRRLPGNLRAAINNCLLVDARARPSIDQLHAMLGLVLDGSAATPDNPRDG